MYADVIVAISAKALDRPFQYSVPEKMCGRIEVGNVVRVPFGGRTVTGYVVALKEKAEIEESRIRPVGDILREGSSEEERLTGLAVWMRERYGGTMLKALRTVIPEKVPPKAKEKKTVFLAVSRESAQKSADVLRRKHQPARLRLLNALIEDGALPYSLIREKLNITPAVLTTMQQMDLIRVETERVYRSMSVPVGSPGTAVRLNEEQQAAVDTFSRGFEQMIKGDCDARPWLLFGVTGSGKTEVYMEMIRGVIAAGRQAIVLIPEIALTYQTLMRFYRSFGDRVSVIHSKMSQGERSDQFERARKGLIDVMIGPRSALFTPFDRLGIIVMDEEHEESYFSQQAPRYSTRETAIRRAKMEGAAVVLGSATPSVESYFEVQEGNYRLLRLTKRAKEEARMPLVRVIDRRQDKAAAKNLIGPQLCLEIAGRLKKKEQVMLFLNRRGLSGTVMCISCGAVLKCPHCDVPLTLHEGGRLVCHYCGYSRPLDRTCPECGSEALKTSRAGTETAVREVQELFPGARILRMDRDSTSGKDRSLEILSAFAGHEADILIGTQMIVKGHDFPLVTLVGILAADMSLNVPDYRAAERTYQLLTQAAGRAGRADRPGLVLIQTFQPDHYCIRTAASGDYEDFYRQEISYRQAALYPPAGSLITIHMTCREQEHLILAAGYLKKFIQRIIGSAPVRVLGPAEESISKIQDLYRMVIYLKQVPPSLMDEVKRRIERYTAANEGFSTVDITFDINH